MMTVFAGEHGGELYINTVHWPTIRRRSDDVTDGYTQTDNYCQLALLPISQRIANGDCIFTRQSSSRVARFMVHMMEL